MPLLPMSPEKLAARRANDRVKRARRQLTRFSTEDAHFTPGRLRHPYRMEQWRALSDEERYEHLRLGMFNNEYARCLDDVLRNLPPRVQAYLALSHEDQAAVDDGTYTPAPEPEPTPSAGAANADSTSTPTLPEDNDHDVASPRARYWLPCRTCGEYVPIENPRAKRAKCLEHNQ